MLNLLKSQTSPLHHFLAENSKSSSKMLKSVYENKLNNQFPENLECQTIFSKAQKVKFPKILFPENLFVP